jgi:hypothetical protein
MRAELSTQQIFRIEFELEPIIVRDFVSALVSSSAEAAFERLARDQEALDTERYFIRMEQILLVCEEVIAERRKRRGGH